MDGFDSFDNTNYHYHHGKLFLETRCWNLGNKKVGIVVRTQSYIDLDL